MSLLGGKVQEVLLPLLLMVVGMEAVLLLVMLITIVVVFMENPILLAVAVLQTYLQ
jgi:hypothetical protein